MTNTMGTTPGGTSPSTPASSDASTRDVAKDEARGVAQDAAGAGKQTAETAKQQAAEVASEAKSQARALLNQTKEQITGQGSAQQEKAATGLHSLADELTGMVRGEGAQSGIAADLAQEASDRIRSAAQWLETREPSDVLNDVRRFARQRPGAFLMSAAAIGFLGGRLTRSIAAESSDDSNPAAGLPSTGYAPPPALSSEPHVAPVHGDPVTSVPPVSPNASGYSSAPLSGESAQTARTTAGEFGTSTGTGTGIGEGRI
jgi:hypothetical protein